MEYIKFSYLDDLLAFLNECETGRIVLGKGERKLREFINLVKNPQSLGYAIELSNKGLNDTNINLEIVNQ